MVHDNGICILVQLPWFAGGKGRAVGGTMGWFDFLFKERDTVKTSAAKPAQVRATSDADAYEAWYDEQVRLGLADIDAGRVVAHEEVVKRGEALLRRLERKHAKAA